MSVIAGLGPKMLRDISEKIREQFKRNAVVT